MVDVVRTPRGKGKAGGALADLHPQELLAGVFAELQQRVALDPAVIEDVITGCAVGEGDHGDCIGRLAVLGAGWPVTVPGVTLNRFCGSGQQALNFAAMMIRAKQADVCVAAGVEMMSRYQPGGRPTLDGGNRRLRDAYPLVPQGISADLIATVEGFSRLDVDTYAAESQRRASIATTENRFIKSMMAVTDPGGAVMLEHEELPRPTSLEQLAQLKPAFAALGSAVLDGYPVSFDDNCRATYPGVTALEHVHHAGNSSGIADGAAAVLLASPRAVAAHGWPARARVSATAAVGSEPVIMLTAPGPVTQRCLNRAGMQAGDIDLFEVNEAFAAVVLKFMRDVGVDHDRINVNGGAIALGHPIGATGPMLVATLLDELERRDLSVGLVSMCTGGGMGTATIIERT
ncbi:acetyl-CoA C-acyltransferase [Mycobacterium branderi]|uniref:acetyl-CoA C-acyltransferase n=1 Tax=Mycobacterium branderi TaxID=43348 RepID=UPI001E5FD148|nr:acetyl-CoA C-acyltransferase [Mycobacterium branderi]